MLRHPLTPLPGILCVPRHQILEDQVRQATQLHRKLRLVSETLKQLVLARRAQDEEMDEARTRQLEMQNETLRHLLVSQPTSPAPRILHILPNSSGTHTPCSDHRRPTMTCSSDRT